MERKRKNPTGVNAHNWQGGISKIKRNCIVCGKSFEIPQRVINKGNGKYCSYECYWSDMEIKEEKNPNWKGGKPKCVDCGKEISYGSTRCPKCSVNEPERVKKNRAKRPYMSGENHPLWIKDRTKLKTARKQAYDVKYKNWMLEVKRRDGWKCKINNKDCKGQLEAHHILAWRNYPELRYDVNNGITLCQAHHPRCRAEEKRLVAAFKQLVTVSN